MAREVYSRISEMGLPGHAARQPVGGVSVVERTATMAKADNSGETCRFNVLDNAHDEEYIHEL